MQFREALLADIRQMQIVRNAVKENRLSNPALVPDEDYELFITKKGKGWVSEQDGQITGFAFVDLEENNIWALFVLPEQEKKGIGSRLHQLMLDWYFSQTTKTVWLGTAPNTRAEMFYRKSGWTETGLHGKNEIKFEMSFSDWQRINAHVSKTP